MSRFHSHKLRALHPPWPVKHERDQCFAAFLGVPGKQAELLMELVTKPACALSGCVTEDGVNVHGLSEREDAIHDFVLEKT